jgi:uncharacterized protein with HEPN domain
MHKNDYYLLLSMKEVIEKILRFSYEYTTAEDFYNNDRDFDATLMNFIALGELVGKFSDQFKEEYDHIDWGKIYSFRNILAHHYFGVNVDVIWQIICNDVPVLKEKINSLLS